jgi:hypothetical protein
MIANRPLRWRSLLPAGFILAIAAQSPTATRPSLGKASDRVDSSQATGAGSTLPTKLDVRLERLPVSKRDYSGLIIGLITSLAAIGGSAWIANRQIAQKNAEISNLNRQKADEWRRQDAQLSTTLDRQLDEEERRRIAGQLNRFYHPIARRLAVSKLLHDQLIRADASRSTGDFRLLIALLEG